MSHQILLLPRVPGAETNARQSGNLSTMFASTATDNSSLTLLVTKEDGAIRHYLRLDETADPGNSHLPLNQAIGGSLETTVLPDQDTAVEAATAVSGQGVDVTPGGIAGLDICPVVTRMRAHQHRQSATRTAVHDYGARTGEVATIHVAAGLAGAR